MDGCDDLWEIAFEFVNVSDCLVDVLLYFINDFLQLLVVNGEIILENSHCLLA